MPDNSDCQFWIPFRLPTGDLLEAPRAQSSALLQLPAEVLLQIFQQSDGTNRICLGLSCKHLLAIAMLLPLQTPDPKAHRAPWNVDPHWTPPRSTSAEQDASASPTCRCRRLETVLRRTRRRHPGQTRALCVDCMKYRPKRKSYWSAAIRPMIRQKRQDWPAEAEQTWKDSLRYFSRGLKIQCPVCALQEKHHDILNPNTER